MIADTLPAGQARGYLIAGRGDLRLITCRLPLEADAPRHVPDLLPAPLAAILSPGEIRMAVPADAFLPTLSHAASTGSLRCAGGDRPGQPRAGRAGIGYPVQPGRAARHALPGGKRAFIDFAARQLAKGSPRAVRRADSQLSCP